MNHRRITRFAFTTVSVLAALAMLFVLAIASSQIDIPGPAGSGLFGNSVTVLPNGNLVICDPGYDTGSAFDVGAAYLYDGADGTLISMLTGSKTSDWICDYGVTVLANGNYLVSSPHWDNGAAWDAGAVTWGDGKTGVSGAVSAANSLVGSSAGDHVGLINDYRAVTALSNGNYVVLSPDWDNGSAANTGAVTWGNGTTGITGPVSAGISLVGSSPGDQVGLFFPYSNGVRELSNGNYVVRSPYWDNGTVVDAGAVTWVNGRSGITGPISAANSLVGSSTGDQIGYSDVVALANGNYVVCSSDWDNGEVMDTGAVTWANGATGITGPVSAANSLVGSTADDQVGQSFCVTELANGNYVVRSPDWDNGGVADAGAVTWGNGATGVTGPVSAANSLVGSSLDDKVGIWGVTALSNGNYVVLSPSWDNGSAANAGAVTWGNGATGITGPVSAANSLVGSTADDQVGDGYFGVVELANENYVVSSPYWDNGSAANAGAVTWVNGRSGITGPISAANSLVGSSQDDRIDGGNVVLLANGNYLVSSPAWDNGSAANAGAVTWGNGATGITGPISAANSLVGSTRDDFVGESVTELTNGNYVVSSPFWDNGALADAGAVTWANGNTGVTGPVSVANSLVGSSLDDKVGIWGVTALSNGNYVLRSPTWDNGSVADAGAVTWGDGATGIAGLVSAANSLVGSSANDNVGTNAAKLSNGNYVVSSPFWDNGAVTDAGAVTWGNGETGITGPVGAAKSLVGNTRDDYVGLERTIALPNGNYLVVSTYWDHGTAADAGAVTWGDGKTGVVGPVSATNSLVGSNANDYIGATSDEVCDEKGICYEELANGVSVLFNGDYVVSSYYWDNGALADAGAVTWGDGATGIRGPITAENSVRGEAIDGGSHMSYKYDPYNEQLAVSRPSENTVTLFRPNRVPFAQAGRPLIVARGALVHLDGSASYDPDGNLPLQFTWTQTGGPLVVLSDPQAVSPTFTAPDERTSLTFNLVVTDALGSSSQPSNAIVFVDPYQYFLPIMPEH